MFLDQRSMFKIVSRRVVPIFHGKSDGRSENWIAHHSFRNITGYFRTFNVHFDFLSIVLAQKTFSQMRRVYATAISVSNLRAGKSGLFWLWPGVCKGAILLCRSNNIFCYRLSFLCKWNAVKWEKLKRGLGRPRTGCCDPSVVQSSRFVCIYKVNSRFNFNLPRKVECVGFFFSAFDSAPSKHFNFVLPRFFDWRQFVLAADRNANRIFSTNVLSYAYAYHCYVVWKNWLSWRENYAGQTRRDIQYKHQFWFRRNNASKYEISIWCPPLNWRYFVLSTAEVFYLTFEPH